MKALITGITGFVGTNLAIYLRDQGHEVAGLCRPGSFPLACLPEVRLWPTAEDGQGFREALEEFRPDVVVHLAAHYRHQHSAQDIDSLVRSNVLYGAHLLEAMRESACNAMVFAGTSWQHYRDATYCPANLYAATKQAFSSLADYYRDAHGLRLLELHLYDCYGPNDPRRKLVDQLQDRARSGIPLPMSNGEQRIHLLHVEDLAQGLMSACQMVLEFLPGHQALYRLPSHKAISLRELVAQFNEANPENPVQVVWGELPYREREIFVPWEDSDTLPGWKPQITLAEGLRDICRQGDIPALTSSTQSPYKETTMSEPNDLNQLLQNFELGTLESDTEKFSIPRDRPLYLYGAGNMGKRLYRQLTENDIQVTGFIDRNPAAKHDDITIPTFTPNASALEAAKTTATIILSGLFPLKVCQDIKATLTTLGFQHVHALHEINFSCMHGGSIRQNLFDDNYNKLDVLGTDRPKIEQAFKLLAGESDQQLFLGLLKAHLTMDFTRLDEPLDISLQYLAHDIPDHKDYTRFIDCGGYDGDTFRQLVGQGIAIDALAAFEPQVEMYRKYTDSIAAHLKPPQQAFLFPCGVHSETSQLRFASNNDARSAARLSNEGDQVIQCVAIDEALHGFRPTFLKMDIEGAEIGALHGARKTIESVGPGLAICVYHRFSDLWEIPCLISSMRTDYRYYLRNYNYLGLETVLYALRPPN